MKLPCILIWRRKFDLSVNSTGTEEGRVEDVDPVGGHDHLDVLGGLEAVKLIEELQHGPLDLAVPPSAGLYPGGADAVDLVHEDDAGGVLSTSVVSRPVLSVSVSHLAITKSSLTIRLPSPINFCTSSEPETLGGKRAF